MNVPRERYEADGLRNTQLNLELYFFVIYRNGSRDVAEILKEAIKMDEIGGGGDRGDIAAAR